MAIKSTYATALIYKSVSDDYWLASVSFIDENNNQITIRLCAIECVAVYTQLHSLFGIDNWKEIKD